MTAPEDNLKEIETLKIDSVKAEQIVSKLYVKTDIMKEANDKLSDKILELEIKSKYSQDSLEDVITLLKGDIISLTENKLSLEAQLGNKQMELAECKMTAKAKIERLLADWDSERTAMNEKYKNLEDRFYQVADFEEKKADLEGRITALEANLENEKANRILEVMDKEREKVELGERLRKEMEEKIQETRTQMLALKKEQLDTTARIAVLQNYQISTELEYQSKNLEKLVKKQNKVMEENTKLKREMQVHKEIEFELAKKTSKTQSVIRKLGERVQELEEQLAEQAKKKIENQESEGSTSATSHKSKDEFIKFLEKTLQEAEKKIAKLQNDYGILLRDFERMKNRIEHERDRYNDAATLVKETLENIIEGENRLFNDSESANHIALDLDDIKGSSIESLSSIQKQMLFNVILEQIKVHLNERNLANEYYPILSNKSSGYGIFVVDKKAYHLPNIHEKSMNNKLNLSKFDYSPKAAKIKHINQSSPKEWDSLLNRMSPITFKEKVKYKIGI